MSQRFEGRNLEEALNSAAQQYGVERWQLTYGVLLEKRGFLGGVKRVVIEADINEAAIQPPPVAAAATAATAPVSSGPPRAERSARGPRGNGGGGGARGGGGGGRGGRSGGGNRGGDRRERAGRGGGGGGRGRQRDDADTLQPGDFEQFANVEVPDQGPESGDATAVREWIEELVDRARLDLDLRTEENETQIIVRLYGRDSGRVIDRHGELLDAIQVLTNKALVGRKLEKDIELDCQQFKERRVEELGQKAREVADRVRRDRREELLPAMSPIERRIIHLALQDDAEVATESRGEGFYKRVAVILRGASEEAGQTEGAS
jgi:predicted RNA-binding protein Jag